MKRIILAVTNDLATDQRVDRTCRALTEEGWEVTLVGRKLRNSLPLETRPYSTHRMRLVFRRSALFYAEYNLLLFLLLLFRKADCLFANDTDTLAACCLASRILRKPLVFDAHELFPEVPELAGRPRVKAIWEWVERVSLPYAKCCFTVCQSVADEYRRRYGVEMTVVRNVPDRPAQPPQEPSDGRHGAFAGMPPGGGWRRRRAASGTGIRRHAAMELLYPVSRTCDPLTASQPHLTGHPGALSA